MSDYITFIGGKQQAGKSELLDEEKGNLQQFPAAGDTKHLSINLQHMFENAQDIFFGNPLFKPQNTNYQHLDTIGLKMEYLSVHNNYFAELYCYI